MLVLNTLAKKLQTNVEIRVIGGRGVVDRLCRWCGPDAGRYLVLAGSRQLVKLDASTPSSTPASIRHIYYGGVESQVSYINQ